MINTNCGKPFQLTIILASSSESKFEFSLLVFAFGIFKFWIWILNLPFVFKCGFGNFVPIRGSAARNEFVPRSGHDIRVRSWYSHTVCAPLIRVVLTNHEITHNEILLISYSHTGGAASILLNMFENAAQTYYWCLNSNILHV